MRTGGEERGRGHEHERPSDRGNSAGSRNLFVKNKDPREDLQEESSLPASSSSSSFFCAEASLSPPKAACSRPSFSSADSPHERKDERRKDEGEGELKSPREEEFSRILNTSFSSSPSPSAAWGKEISKPKKSSYRQRAVRTKESRSDPSVHTQHMPNPTSALHRPTRQTHVPLLRLWVSRSLDVLPWI